MLKNLDPRREQMDMAFQHNDLSLSPQGLAAQLRAELMAALDDLAQGKRHIHVPTLPPDPEWTSRGEGHFHLSPQLFLQLRGWTLFRFPHAQLLLKAGELLLVPPKLLHLEQVGAGEDGAAFSNLVVYAEYGIMSCHLAHEISGGIPQVQYLEARKHVQALRIQEWMSEVARLQSAPTEVAAGMDSKVVTTQARALLLAVVAGVLRIIGEPQTDAAEPPLVARVRVFVQSQLGDHQLSVRQLAEQAGCSADYLSHLFHSASGEHLVAYINRQRMERATKLLRETALSGKEIAWACGFASQSYFIRSFRSSFDITPREWRAALQSGASPNKTE